MLIAGVAGSAGTPVRARSPRVYPGDGGGCAQVCPGPCPPPVSRPAHRGTLERQDAGRRTPGWADGVTADRPARRAGAEAVSLANAIHALPGQSADSLRVASWPWLLA